MAILIWPIENSTECTSDYRRQNRNYKNRNAVANEGVIFLYSSFLLWKF